MIGTRLGNYLIDRLIGQGGMGAVYGALQEPIHRRVAIKVLLPELASRADLVARFFNEARAASTLNHPGVVQISDYGNAPDGSVYLVMEHLEGQTLQERIRNVGPQLPASDVILIGWQLSEVLAAAHAKEIVHRDIKPSSISSVENAT